MDAPGLVAPPSRRSPASRSSWQTECAIYRACAPKLTREVLQSSSRSNELYHLLSELWRCGHPAHQLLKHRLGRLRGVHRSVSTQNRGLVTLAWGGSRVDGKQIRAPIGDVVNRLDTFHMFANALGPQPESACWMSAAGRWTIRQSTRRRPRADPKRAKLDSPELGPVRAAGRSTMTPTEDIKPPGRVVPASDGDGISAKTSQRLRPLGQAGQLRSSPWSRCPVGREALGNELTNMLRRIDGGTIRRLAFGQACHHGVEVRVGDERDGESLPPR
jgi:hypothetical protein